MYREYDEMEKKDEEEKINEEKEGYEFEEPESEAFEYKKPQTDDKITVVNKTSFMKIITVAVIASMIGGLFTAYIAPTYLYGKIIKDPYSGFYYQNGPSYEIVSETEGLTVVSAVAKKAMPSVVGITTVAIQNDFIFGSRRAEGVGTGVIVDSRGYILTNSHVINDGDVEEVTVLLSNGENLESKVLWNDAILDLAVVKVEKTNLPVAELGDSDNLVIGETAIAIGNPLGLTFERSVTAGIISGLNRSIPISYSESIDSLIQTDASINPGNSGGPLLNSKGRVIGINTAKIQSGEGLGFAIPINMAKPIVDEFIEKGEFSKAYMGIQGIDLEEFEQSSGEETGLETGVFVYKVYKDSPADNAGLLGGDIITKIGDNEIETMNQLIKVLYAYRPGDSETVEIVRNGNALSYEITFVSREEIE
ncbi:MAG TPA: trypsin-like peptidase domain-containing protein [Clostridia bacterium]|nr:trypsin-like peptidase domain-containing protein [Clostridia bacterium]